MKAKVHRILILGTEPALTAGLKRDLFRACPSLTAHELPLVIDRHELELDLTLEAPTAVFLETNQLERSLQVAHWIHEADHNLQIIGFAEHIGTEGLLRLMRAGLREWLPVPADTDSLIVALDRIQAEAATHPPSSWSHGRLVSFLPAKPGTGASTIALHVAEGCARLMENRVLLLDLDLQCGDLGFMTKATGGLTINETLVHAHELDAALWNRLVARTGEVDLLPAGQPAESLQLEPSLLRRVFGFALGRYPLLLADLPGGLDAGAILTLEQSARIFLVSTTDLSSIHLTRRKLDTFAKLGVADKVDVVINRATFHLGLSESGLVEILGRKPVTLVPNAFVPLQNALKDGQLLTGQSPFVKALAPVIQSITGLKSESKPERRLLPALSMSRTLEHLRTVVSSFRPNGNSQVVVAPGGDRSAIAARVEAALAAAPPPAQALPDGRPERRKGQRRKSNRSQSGVSSPQSDRRAQPAPPSTGQ